MLSFLHLMVFDAMIRRKSVTLAAEELEMPQPTLSRHLKFLREHFADALFVRTHKGLEPTSIALSAAPAISDALEIYRTRLSDTGRFDPRQSRRTFSIAASDIGHLLTMPRLQRWAAGTAPFVRFKAVPLARGRLVAQLEAGEVDVAVGSFPKLASGMREQTLFQEQYVCIVPRSLLPRGRLTLARYREAQHVLVEGHPLGHVHEEIEHTLRALLDSQIRIVSESFLLSAHIAEQSEMILTVPSRVAKIVDSQRVRILAPPIDLPGFAVRQYWHERFDRDPGNAWLRATLAGLREAEG